MLPCPRHHDTPRRQQICQYQYTCCPHASSVCVRLPCFPCLHTLEFSASCVRSARWVYTGVQTHVGTCVPLLCDILQTLGTSYVPVTFVYLLAIVLVVLSPFPPPRTQTSYPPPQHPLCPLSQATTIGGGLPPSIMGSRR